MALEIRCLATYIKNIYYGDNFILRENEIFDYEIAHRSFCLKFDCINRILVYSGSFNLLYRGHFELFRYGFGSGGDMNIIAAIVLPLDDEFFVKKLRGQQNALIFNKDERVRLWKGYVLSDWYWTYDCSVSEWCGFQKRFTQAIAKDGFDVSWVALCGPDNAKVNGVFPIPAWGCKDIIVSNAGRPADFISFTMNGLKMLEGCKAWENHARLRSFPEIR